MSSSEDPLVQQAVRFLKDEKVKEAPLAKKIAFLEGKGLTSEQIQLAIQIVSNPNAQVTGSEAPTLPPKKYTVVQQNEGGWKQNFILAGVVLSLGWNLFQCFQWLNDFWHKDEKEDEKKEIEEKLLNQALELFQKQTEEKVEDAKLEICQQLKSSVASKDSMHEIQTELKSLKGLLLNRRQFPPAPVYNTSTPLNTSGTENGQSLLPEWQKVSESQKEKNELKDEFMTDSEE